MAFADLAAEVTGNLPGLSGFLAAAYVTRAYRKIRDARLWSFLVTDDAIVCPAQVTTGTVAFAQYGITVTANAAASAALIALNTVQTPLTLLQIRFGSSAPGEIYNIVTANVSVPTAVVLTVDRAIQETTAPASTYLVYRPYVSIAIPDFLSWISVVDMVNGWQLRIGLTSTQFDVQDPRRQAFGEAYCLGFYKASTDTPPKPIYELWPGPTEGQTLYVRYRRQGTDFAAPTDVQPTLIPDDLILQAALGFYAYPWAMANPGHFPAMKGVNWMQLIADAKKTFFVMLQDAKRQDDNQAVQSVWARGHGLRGSQGFPYPADANFVQSHLVPLP